HDPQQWWKARAMEDWLATHEHGRAIWIGDDLACPATREYFLENYSSNRLKVIAPDFSHLLTKAHRKENQEVAYPKTDHANPYAAKTGDIASGDHTTTTPKTNHSTTSDPKGTS